MDLIERLQNAAEGEWRLDYEIARSLGWYEAEVSEHWEIAWFKPDSKIQQLSGPPHYTTSLDAALTLVPEGCGWKVQRNLNGDCWAVVQRQDANRRIDIWAESDMLKTPALALCIAAMKASEEADG